MKNFAIVILAFISIGFSSCRKDSSCSNNLTSDKISIAGSTVVKTGVVNFTNKELTGTTTVYQQKNGAYILAFEQMQFASTVDADVKIASSETSTNNAIKLFSVKNISDHFYYELPSTININAFNYLFFQTDVSDAPVGTVTLK